MSINRRSVRFRNNKKIQAKEIKIISSALIIIIFICSTILITKNIKNRKYVEDKQEEVNRYISEIFKSVDNENQDNTKYAKITFTGDILGRTDVYESVHDKSDDTYDFEPIFDEIKQYTKDSNLCVGNLETNFAKQEYSGNGKYNTPTNLGECLKKIGVSVLNLANNHSMDYGISGITDTKDFLESVGIENVGTNRGNENRFIVKDVNGIKIAFLSYTYGVNNENTEENLAQYINFIDKDKIKNDIEEAKTQAEYICVNMHWGDIGTTEITTEQKELADFLVESGANLILGTHPSKVQQIEVRKNQQGEDVVIVYSMGNFLSDTSEMGIILDIKLAKNSKENRVTLGKVEYKPIYLLDNGKKSENRYKIIDVKNALEKYSKGNTEEISQKTYKKLADEYINIGKLLESRQ